MQSQARSHCSGLNAGVQKGAHVITGKTSMETESPLVMQSSDPFRP